MPIPLFTNNAATALAVAITPTDTVLQVVAGTGQQFPSPTGGNYFMLTLIQINNPEVGEIVKCIGRTGDFLTVERGQENTQPQIFNISDNVQLRITAQSLNLFAQGGGGGGGGAATNQAEFTATQGQTVFTLPFSYIPDEFNLAVFVNGSKQIVDVNYSESSSTTVTFLSGLNVGDLVEVIYNLPIAAGQVDASNISYDEGGVGAIERTVQSKLQESVSVKDFGAVGDGVADDTTAIQAAINATPLYGILIFPQGNYNVSSTLNLPQSIGLVGGEVGSRGVQQATLKWTATGGTMFTVASGSTGIGTSFKGLRIVNNTTSDATLIAATATFGLVVEECLFSGVGTFTHAIFLKETSTGSNDGSFDSLIIHNTFANASVYVDSVSNDTKIIENQFFAEIANYGGAQLFASTTSSSGLNSLLISGNNFEGTLVNTAYAVDLTLVTGCVFENNRVEIYTGGTVKFTQMLGSCTVTGNFLNQPYVYSGSRATSANNEGQQFTEFSNYIAQQTNNTFTEINNIQGVFSGKNLFDIGNINTDWYFGNCSYSYIENGSLGFRSPVLELLTPTSGTSSGLESSNMIQDPELQLAIANEAFTTTVFIVKAPSTNVATSVVTVYTGDALEYWTVPKDNKWHVIKVVRRMQTGDTVFQPTAYLAYASSYNAADTLYIAGIGVWVGTGAFELPFFNSFTQSPSAASNTGAWITGEIVQNMAASTTGNPVGFVCTASGTPGTWHGYGALI